MQAFDKKDGMNRRNVGTRCEISGEGRRYLEVRRRPRKVSSFR
jgi:hypothetical protein